MSEDPLLTGALASAYVGGLQDNGVGTTPKHYVANDFETDRFTVDVVVDERPLRELYLRPFEDVVAAGAWSVMSAYNSINGATATENDLLETPLKTEWDWDGVVISDWTAARSLHSAEKEQDLVMPGPQGPWGEALTEAVRSGRIREETIDRKVRRILVLAARVGAREPCWSTTTASSRSSPARPSPWSARTRFGPVSWAGGVPPCSPNTSSRRWKVYSNLSARAWSPMPPGPSSRQGSSIWQSTTSRTRRRVIPACG
jgi:beta-glucosidase-like glycosyl hydrolase